MKTVHICPMLMRVVTLNEVEGQIRCDLSCDEPDNCPVIGNLIREKEFDLYEGFCDSRWNSTN